MGVAAEMDALKALGQEDVRLSDSSAGVVFGLAGQFVLEEERAGKPD
jgi:hypothetical protein